MANARLTVGCRPDRAASRSVPAQPGGGPCPLPFPLLRWEQAGWTLESVSAYPEGTPDAPGLPCVERLGLAGRRLVQEYRGPGGAWLRVVQGEATPMRSVLPRCPLLWTASRPVRVGIAGQEWTGWLGENPVLGSRWLVLEAGGTMAVVEAGGVETEELLQAWAADLPLHP